MQAQEIPLSMFLNKGKNFIIPVYQRNYDWKRKQCAQLLKDIESVQADQLYFIGSIVHKRKSNLITQAELVIIDGQQRITTITLFLLRIAELFKEHGDILYQQLWNNYNQNRYEVEEEMLKLKQIISDIDLTQFMNTLSVVIQNEMTIEELAMTDFFFQPHFNKPWSILNAVALKAL